MAKVMYPYYSRVYTMKDGSKCGIFAVYESYELAENDLGKFNPSGEGVDDMANVDYVQIEKRFSPTPV